MFINLYKDSEGAFWAAVRDNKEEAIKQINTDNHFSYVRTIFENRHGEWIEVNLNKQQPE